MALDPAVCRAIQDAINLNQNAQNFMNQGLLQLQQQKQQLEDLYNTHCQMPPSPPPPPQSARQ